MTEYERSDWWERWREGLELEDLVSCQDLLKLHLLDRLRDSPRSEISLDANDALRKSLEKWSVRNLASQREIETALDDTLRTLFDSEAPWDDDLRRGYLLRRQRDMIDQRRIPTTDFRTAFICAVHERVLWGCYRTTQLLLTFRIDTDGTFIDVNDEPIEFPEATKIGVVHPLEMPETERLQWEQVFADYELRGFDQLLRSIEHQESQVVNRNDIHLTGVVNHDVLGTLGWHTPRDQQSLFTRRFSWSSHLELGEIVDHGDSVRIQFRDTQSRGLKPIQAVNPVVLFESIRAAQQAIARAVD